MSNAFIRKDILRVSPELVKQASAYQAAILADVQGRRGTMHGRIRPLNPKMKVAGPAFTVEVRGGDNLMIHAALALAKPGDVIVVDGKTDLTCALMGELMATNARLAGFAGLVIDGAMRDTDVLAQGDYPIFCAGTNPNGPTKFIPGRVNFPISAGNTTIHPGDLIVGDADGVTVIARDEAEQVVRLAQGKVDTEAARFKEMAGGQLAASWLLPALVAAGVLKAGEAL